MLVEPFLNIFDLLLEPQELCLRRIIVIIFPEELIELFLSWRSHILLFFFILYEIFKPRLKLVWLHILTASISMLATESHFGLERHRFRALGTNLILKIVLLRRFLKIVVLLSRIRISRQLLVVISLSACRVIKTLHHAVSLRVKIMDDFGISSLVRLESAHVVVAVHEARRVCFVPLLVVNLVCTQILVNRKNFPLLFTVIIHFKIINAKITIRYFIKRILWDNDHIEMSGIHLNFQV